MKKRRVFLPLFLFPLFIIPSSCKYYAYGLEEFFYRENTLDKRIDTLTLTVIGDIMLHSRQMEYPYGPFLAGVAPRLRKADFAIGNMEFTLGGEPYSGYPAFSAPAMDVPFRLYLGWR